MSFCYKTFARGDIEFAPQIQPERQLYFARLRRGATHYPSVTPRHLPLGKGGNLYCTFLRISAAPRWECDYISEGSFARSEAEGFQKA